MPTVKVDLDVEMHRAFSLNKNLAKLNPSSAHRVYLTSNGTNDFVKITDRGDNLLFTVDLGPSKKPPLIGAGIEGDGPEVFF